MANIIENGLNPGETYLRIPHTWTGNFNQGKYNNGLKPVISTHFNSHLNILHHFQWNRKGKVHICNRFHWLEVEDQYILRLHNTADHSLRRRQFDCHRTFLCILPGMRIPCKQTCCSCWPGHHLLEARTGLRVRRRTCVWRVSRSLLHLGRQWQQMTS